jgi:hypothetical protein
MSLDKPPHSQDNGDQAANSPQEQREGGLFAHVMEDISKTVNYDLALNGWNNTVGADKAHKAERNEANEVNNAVDIWSALKATQKNGSMMGQVDVATSDRERAFDGAQYSTDGLYVSATAAAMADQRFDSILKPQKAA